MSMLLAYRFPPGAAQEGRLLGALERVYGGGAVRVLDLLYVTSDAATGAPAALTGRGRGDGTLVTSLVGFRLDAAERARATARAERSYGREGAPDLVRHLGATLQPGGAVVVLLVEETHAHAVDKAARDFEGSPLLNEPAEATKLAALAERVVAAASRTGA